MIEESWRKQQYPFVITVVVQEQGDRTYSKTFVGEILRNGQVWNIFWKISQNLLVDCRWINGE